jgi:hypothetical protein
MRRCDGRKSATIDSAFLPGRLTANHAKVLNLQSQCILEALLHGCDACNNCWQQHVGSLSGPATHADLLLLLLLLLLLPLELHHHICSSVNGRPQTFSP